MKASIALALALAGALSLRAQTPAQIDPSAPTILFDGTVVDRETGTPVAGARLTVSPLLTDAIVRAASTPKLASAVADNQGHFQVRVPAGNSYRFYADVSGYARPAQGELVTVAEGSTAATVQISLARLASIRGIVVDAETRKPVAGVAVQAFRRTSVLMMSVSVDGGQDKMVTQADGAFLLRNIPDEEVFLRLLSEPRATVETIPAADLEGANRDKALEAPKGASGYGEVYWPGRDADMPSSPGLRASSGTLDVGEIPLERHALHTLTGVINGCEPGASMQLLFTPPSRRDATVDHDLHCGEGFRILNYPDGSFTLSIVQGGPPRRFAFQQIDSGTRGPLNLTPSTTQTVQIEIELEGVKADDTPADLKGLWIQVDPENVPVRISAPDRTANGTLEADLFSGIRYWLNFPASPKYYLKRVSYNGVESTDLGGFVAYGGALRLIFSDHPGSLTVKGERTLGGGIVAVREGLAYSSLSNESLGIYHQMPVLKDQGSAGIVIRGMRPGSYRILQTDIFPPDQGRYEEMMRTAPSVSIEEGQAASVAITSP